jgi:hypothetical protein
MSPTRDVLPNVSPLRAIAKGLAWLSPDNPHDKAQISHTMHWRSEILQQTVTSRKSLWHWQSHRQAWPIITTPANKGHLRLTWHQPPCEATFLVPAPYKVPLTLLHIIIPQASSKMDTTIPAEAAAPMVVVAVASQPLTCMASCNRTGQHRL